MKYLFAGTMSEKRMEALVELTSIRSETVIEGLYWHLCKGHRIETAAALACIKQPVLHRAIQTLDNVAGIVERIKEIDRQAVIAGALLPDVPDDVVINDFSGDAVD